VILHTTLKLNILTYFSKYNGSLDNKH